MFASLCDFWVSYLNLDGGVYAAAAQLIGLIALTVSFISFQSKTQKAIMIMQVVSTCLFAVHFYMLGAFSGMLLNIAACLRSFIFSFRNKYKWAASPFWAVFFILVCAVLSLMSVFGGEGAAALLPLGGMILTTFAGRCREASKVRLLTILNSPFWLSYNLLSGSIPGVLTEILVSGSIIIGMIRLDRKKGTCAEADNSLK